METLMMALKSPRHTPLPELIVKLRKTGLDVAIEAADVLASLLPDKHELVIDMKGGTAARAGVTVRLTPNQVAILHTLHAYIGVVVPLRTIHQRVYGKRVNEIAPRVDNTVRVQTNVLRQRIEPLHAVIHTAHGVGYQLELLPIPSNNHPPQ